VKEQILATARRMVEEGGPEALSMRKLAAELGVAPTAIYWHVGGRDDLVDALLDDLLHDLGDIKPSGRSPQTRVASIARALRDQVKARPHLVALAMENGRLADMYFPAQHALAREVTASGLAGKAAADAVRSVLYLVGGQIALEATMAEHESDSARMVERWQAVDDPEVDPGLLAQMQRPADPDAVFEHALSSLLTTLLRQ
jgi:AcrR family transcriptional regulator